MVDSFLYILLLKIKDNEGIKKEANVEGDDAEKDKHKEHEREKEKGVDVFILE